ncbi:MAG: pseudouridine synthase [Candidatus Rokuibacteriota bacterium]
MPQPVRLQKFLSQAGIASRRAAEELIRSGRVRVNGETVAELGTKVDPSRDAVEVDGRMVRPAARVWIAVYKPRGLVSTRSDPEGRRTLYDVLPPRFRRLFYVGRLDRVSEGLMLLTNDGDAAHRLLHPRYGVSREYEVSLAGRLTKAERDRLLDGVTLEDGLARAESIRATGRSQTGASRVRIVLREGRKREVRRMFEAVGHRVRRLVRVRYGPVDLGELEPGAWRELTDAEVERIKSKVES